IHITPTKPIQQANIITHPLRQGIINIKIAKARVKILQGFTKTVSALQITFTCQHDMKEHRFHS
ncbi:MAG: hypothetical protein ACPLVJ_01590, partial [Candidatus Bathyarchaeales archaeon]